MKTGFIGIGNMGGAILTGYASSPKGRADRIMICDKKKATCEAFIEKFPQLSMTDTAADLIHGSEVVVLGVKPQVIEDVLETAAKVWHRDKLLISMAAGISIEYIRRFLGEDAHVVRIMPNTPAMVGEGMIAVCSDEKTPMRDLDYALGILDTVGRAEVVPEDMIDCVIGVSGSSPAYTYMYIEALVKAAKANGMPGSQARKFAAQAVLGAAKMVLESPESLEQLRINVCSPGGTTIEAVDKLFENGFMEDVQEGFQAAVDRSVEMTNQKKLKK